ncbi:MAG: cbb3-type cytochrome c oxidase N-terminal domain-containing protein [Bacteroidia bacterium]|nr:cbb3-type cytochrome c oxidase N-terminal domain-containing protein [Bacteroidia bacterium]
MNNFNKIKSLAVAMLIPAVGFCQEQTTKESTSYFTNVLFLTLLVTIVVLAIVIVAFSSVFKNIADSDYLTSKYSNKKDDNSSGIRNVTTVLLMLSSLAMMSQEKAVTIAKVDDGRIGGLDQFTFYFMLAIVFIELVVLGLIIYQFNFLVKTHTVIETASKDKKVESKIIMSLTDAVAVEEEESIMLDHDYDGIRELDNNLPPWWKYGFYLTIVVAVIYLINFHVLGTGDLQLKEYEKEITKAKLEVDEFMKNSASNVDENTVKLLTESSDIEAGKAVFIANCAACHGQLGEGTVGPNFADDYWIHGGSVQDIFKSIKYGWVEKGMKSWKEDLSPMQISQVTSFIKSLRGTNPPNAKAPQGDLYVEGGAAPVSDSTAVAGDSLNVHVDSLKTAAAVKK